MEVKKYDKIVLDSTRSIDDIAAGIKAELSKQESQNAGESYICYVSHAYSSGENAGVNYIVVSDEFKNLNGLSSNVIKASAYTKDEINELIATKVDRSELDNKSSELNSRIDSVNTTLTSIINTKANQSTTYTKTEVDTRVNAKANSNAVVNLTGNQTIAGVKTFSSVPVSATNPTNNNQVANKAYVDTVGNTAVKLTGNQTIAGTKTFSSPVVVPDATATTHAVNLSQLNTKANANATVNLTGNQTIAGVKTFSSVPVCATKPTNANQVANKAYVDGLKQVPDYSAAINITPNKSFTAQFNGVLEIYAIFSQNGGISVSLGGSSDGSKNILGCSSGLASNISFGGQAIIVKGQKYYFYASTANLYRAIICPFKGVN